MPDLDGFEVCRRLREDAILMAVPVIFLTALDDEESRLKGLEMMGDAYLTKPVKSNLLLAKIASKLRLQSMREQHLQLQLSQQLQEKNKRNLSAAWQINQALTEKFRLAGTISATDCTGRGGVDSAGQCEKGRDFDFVLRYSRVNCDCGISGCGGYV